MRVLQKFEIELLGFTKNVGGFKAEICLDGIKRLESRTRSIELKIHVNTDKKIRKDRRG